MNTLTGKGRLSLENDDYAGFLQSLEQQVLYAYVVTQAARPWLKLCRGAVVNLITAADAGANGTRAALTAAWAAELDIQGIRVNGVVSTGEQDEISATIIFLLSPAAIGMQGELLYVDDGYTHLDRSIDIST